MSKRTGRQEPLPLPLPLQLLPDFASLVPLPFVPDLALLEVEVELNMLPFPFLDLVLLEVEVELKRLPFPALALFERDVELLYGSS